MAGHTMDSPTRDEQYPLLKVVGGGGDNPNIQAPTGWTVTCPRRRSWLARWPEFVSACWMTFILVGICFLALYTLGMAMTRRQAVMVQYLKEHELRHVHTHALTDNEVFYHHIIDRGSPVPFLLYMEYFTEMAILYPYLRFNIFFLTDDSAQSFLRWQRHSRGSNKLVPISRNCKMDENIKREISNIQKRYDNVNVTVMPLSKYMSATQLKYKWRNIPISYLIFYARVYSVWQHGGIALDMPTFFNKYETHQIDDRINIIFKNQNDGLRGENNKVRKEEKYELSMLLNDLTFMLHQAWNETRAIINNSLSWSGLPNEENSTNNSLQRVHRSKRDLSNHTKTDSLINALALNFSSKSENNSNNAIAETTTLFPFNVKTFTGNTNVNSSAIISNQMNTHFNNEANASPAMSPTIINKSEIQTDMPTIILFYDFSVISDIIGPVYNISDPLAQNSFSHDVNNMNSEISKQCDDLSKQLTIDSDGKFIAAYSRFHPFLGHLISAGYRSVSPKFAIEEAVLTHCSNVFHMDSYCKNIQFL